MLSRTEGCQISVISAACVSSVLEEAVEGAGLVAGPAGWAGLVTVLVSKGGGVEGGKGAAGLVAGLADDDGGGVRGGPDGAVRAAWKAAALALFLRTLVADFFLWRRPCLMCWSSGFPREQEKLSEALPSLHSTLKEPSLPDLQRMMSSCRLAKTKLASVLAVTVEDILMSKL